MLYTRSVPPELAPWSDLLAQLPRELESLQARVVAGERLLRAVRKLHAEWPRDARRRVLLVQGMIDRWQRRSEK